MHPITNGLATPLAGQITILQGKRASPPNTRHEVTPLGVHDLLKRSAHRVNSDPHITRSYDGGSGLSLREIVFQISFVPPPPFAQTVYIKQQSYNSTVNSNKYINDAVAL